VSTEEKKTFYSAAANELHATSTNKRNHAIGYGSGVPVYRIKLK
jgi:hypothetical protein